MTIIRWLCSICHAECEWRTCWKCDGEGYCDDDRCPVCDGDGGWQQCPHHHSAPVKRVEEAT